MCKFVKYGIVFTCGIATGIFSLIASAYVLANRCNFADDFDDNYEIDEDLEI